VVETGVSDRREWSPEASEQRLRVG
jgi:hypothetical protein